MTAYTFTLRRLETGHHVGQAVLCAEARYVSVWWVGAERPDRKFAAPAAWPGILRELAAQLPASPLERTSAIAQLLTGDEGSELTVQYLAQQPIDPSTAPAAVGLVLDQRLRLLAQ